MVAAFFSFTHANKHYTRVYYINVNFVVDNNILYTHHILNSSTFMMDAYVFNCEPTNNLKNARIILYASSYYLDVHKIQYNTHNLYTL